MSDAKRTPKSVHEFCSGGGCCPVLEEYADGTIAIVEDGKELVTMNAETALKLAETIRRVTGKWPRSIQR